MRRKLHSIWRVEGGPEMLAEAWDASQSMALEGSRQGAFLASAAIALGAQLKSDAAVDMRFILAGISLGVSVLACILLHVINAALQQSQLKQVMDAPHTGVPDEEALRAALEHLSDRWTRLKWSIVVQGGALFVGLSLLVISICF